MGDTAIDDLRNSCVKRLEVHYLTLGTGDPAGVMTLLQEIKCLLTIIYLLLYSQPLLRNNQTKTALVVKIEVGKTS